MLQLTDPKRFHYHLGPVWHWRASDRYSSTFPMIFQRVEIEPSRTHRLLPPAVGQDNGALDAGIEGTARGGANRPNVRRWCSAED